MRVLLAPMEIAGYMGRLKQGLIENHIDTRFWDINAHPFKYNNSDTTLLISSFRYLYDRSKYIPRVVLITISIFFRILFSLQALLWADVIIFGGGATFLFGLDLPVYKFFKKKIILIYLGSDSRPLYLNGKVTSNEQFISYSECYKRTKRQKKKIIWFDKFATAIIDHPPSAIFHERPIIPFLQIGFPVPDVPNLAVSNKRKTEIRIVHAPSFPECKGTYEIRKVISHLKDRYPELQYIELINKPNCEVINELAKADFVIDQLYSDTVLAGLGAEAAVLGKATLVGGYVNLNQLGVPPNKIPPAYRIEPDDLEKALVFMIENIDQVHKEGERAKEFVLKYWQRASVAKRILMIINNKIPTGWYYNPEDMCLSLGWGIQKEKLHSYLSEYTRLYDMQALFLEDKPQVRDSYIQFIEGTSS